MTKKSGARLQTGVRNLDDLFHGGIPKNSVIAIAGSPGAGKTILAQQICFHTASAKQRVLYFNTLSEPTAKTLQYLSQFQFFDQAKLDAGHIQFIDLGVLHRTQGLEESARLIMEQVRKLKPTIVVIDSFKVFDDLAKSREELRKFGYELAVSLMAWETTAFLLGEYGPDDVATNPLFSIVDGLVLATQRERSGEQQRFIQIVKARGTVHSRDEHSFVITSDGIEVFAPRVTIERHEHGATVGRCQTGIARLDDLLGDGIPRGSSLLIAGVAGTGKTVLLLEFIYRGAKEGEKGIIFSFEETPERLRATALGLGWDFDQEMKRGMIEIVFIPQPNILVEGHLLMMRERVEAMKARRVAVDSVSVFLHKIKDPQIDREKVFQLATIVQNAGAVGFFATDIPYGSNQISRFGVEETVVDGVILLSSTEEGLERQRYIEIYKLRNTAHLKGRHPMVIGPGGLTIFPRYGKPGDFPEVPPPLEAKRLSWGVPDLDKLCGGGLLHRSVTLVSGSAGIGKSTLGLQFVLEGARRKEPGLYVTLEEGPAQLLEMAQGLGLPLKRAVDKGLIELVYLPREDTRASQLLTILDDKVRTKQARRLVLDGVSTIARGGVVTEELQQLLFKLVTRFKSLDVTSVLTLESGTMYATDTVTERGFSPIADNLLLLRYTQVPGAFHPTLSVVKTRGSAHDWGTYFYSIANGGIRVGDRLNGGNPEERVKKRVGRRSRK